MYLCILDLKHHLHIKININKLNNLKYIVICNLLLKIGFIIISDAEMYGTEKWRSEIVHLKINFKKLNLIYKNINFEI